MKLKNKKVTKLRHPEMVSYGNVLDIPTGGPEHRTSVEEGAGSVSQREGT